MVGKIILYIILVWPFASYIIDYWAKRIYIGVKYIQKFWRNFKKKSVS